MAFVAFDLDGTLVRGSSFGQFIRLLIGRSPLRLVVAALALPFVMLLAVAIPRSRPLLSAGMVWLATVGRSAVELRGRARRFARAHADDDSGNRVEPALAAANAYLAHGFRVVVVSAAAEPVASEVVRAAGLRGVEVRAPVLVPRLGGWVPSSPGTGPAKLEVLLASGVGLPLLAAYTDSAKDIPLLQAAVHRRVVEPGPGQWRAIRAQIGDAVLAVPGGKSRRRGICDDGTLSDVERILVSASTSSSHHVAIRDGGSTDLVPHEKPEDWGWHQEFKVLPRIVGWAAVVTLLLMLAGNHTGKVEDLWVIGTAAVIVMVLIRDAVRRRNAWRN